MKISIRSDFNTMDAGDHRSVSQLIDKIDIKGSTEVELNFCRCIVQYPETSKIIDKVLFQFGNSNDIKSLKVITDFPLNDLLILSWFLIGSSFFDINENKRFSETKEFEAVINPKLIEKNIRFSISFVNKEVEHKKLAYGVK